MRGVELGRMLRIARWLMVAVVLGVVVPAMGGESVATLPAPTGYVNDFAGVLTPDTKQSLEDLCTQVDQQAHAQIAVVTVKSIDPDKSGATPSIEEFSTALEDKWKVGKKGTDRGILLIFVMNPAPAHGRIEVGYGLEGILPDGKVGDIGREMKPILVSGDLNQGISLGVREVAQDIAADAGVNLGGDANGQPADQYHYQTQPQTPVNPVVLFVIGAVVVVGIGILIFTGHIGLLFFILFNLLSGGGGGGGGNSEGGGGGFGGFGGGGSGGGGANF
jgi:uncharacterized protein